MSRYFEPLLRTLDLRPVAWDNLLTRIEAADRDFGLELRTFYQRALDYNFCGPTRRT